MQVMNTVHEQELLPFEFCEQVLSLVTNVQNVINMLPQAHICLQQTPNNLAHNTLSMSGNSEGNKTFLAFDL